MKMNTFLLGAALFLGSLPNLSAALECARIYQTDMVLPQNKSVPIWGSTLPGKTVQIQFKNQKLSAKADGDGNWSVNFAPMKADARGASMTLSDGTDSLKFDNILVGEVWLASGQSNMQYTMNQVSDHKTEIPKEENPQLRLMNMTNRLHTQGGAYNVDDYKNNLTRNSFDGAWKKSAPENIRSATAVGYLFAKNLQEKLNVPVGLVCNAVGGVGMEAWLPENVINGKPAYASLKGENWLKSPLLSPWGKGRAQQNLSAVIQSGEKDLRHPFKPAFLYKEGMQEGLVPFPFTGVLWYQGETNAENGDQKLNRMMLGDLVDSWRKAFHQKNLPFVIIQLPRINDASSLRAKWPEFREVQDDVSQDRENVALVCTIDLGSTDSNVHPSPKKPVADRAADMALKYVYGKKTAAESPRILQIKPKGKQLLVQTSAKSLKTKDGKEARQFEIAGADGQFAPARAEFKNNIITLTAEGIDAPEDVRYCWATFVDPNVVNEAGLPLFPYRSLKGKKEYPAAPFGVFPKNRKVKVACIGDSITFGMGIGSLAHKYPQILGEMLGEKFEVKNFGNSGKTAGDYPGEKQRRRWYGDNAEFEQAIDYQADIYICNLGINDTGAWWDPALFEEGYQTIVKEMKGRRNPTFAVWAKLGPDYRGPVGKKAFPGNIFDGYSYNKIDNKSSVNRPAAEKIIQTLAKKEKLHQLDAYTALSNHPEWYKDGLHPNEDGARKIAELTYEWLAKAYKLPKAPLSAKAN